jgi:hypothetical protein
MLHYLTARAGQQRNVIDEILSVCAEELTRLRQRVTGSAYSLQLCGARGDQVHPIGEPAYDRLNSDDKHVMLSIPHYCMGAWPLAHLELFSSGRHVCEAERQLPALVCSTAVGMSERWARSRYRHNWILACPFGHMGYLIPDGIDRYRCAR